MNTRQRDAVFQRWCTVIGHEIRDLDSLEQVSTRALADPEVHDDPTLQILIRTELQKRRGELEQEQQCADSRSASLKPRTDEAPAPPEPTSTMPPDQVRETFDRLARSLSTALECGDEKETCDFFAKMQAVRKRSPGVIPDAELGDHQQRVEKLRAYVKRRTDEIATLVQQAISASRNGNEQDLVRSMRRLTAIHAAHPRLLDEPALENVRRDVAEAADERRQHRRTTKKLLERERAVSAEVKKLAVAVREFHRVACKVPDTSEEFREAEATYLRTIQKVRTYDTEWFSGVVLELADLLAEWTEPPQGAEGQIDRFLDSISAGLDRIHAEMRQIETEQDSDEGNGKASGSPEP